LIKKNPLIITQNNSNRLQEITKFTLIIFRSKLRKPPKRNCQRNDPQPSHWNRTSKLPEIASQDTRNRRPRPPSIGSSLGLMGRSGFALIGFTAPALLDDTVSPSSTHRKLGFRSTIGADPRTWVWVGRVSPGFSPSRSVSLCFSLPQLPSLFLS